MARSAHSPRIREPAPLQVMQARRSRHSRPRRERPIRRVPRDDAAKLPSRCAARLGDEPCTTCDHADRIENLLFGDGHDVVDQLAEDRAKVSSPSWLTRRPVRLGERLRAWVVGDDLAPGEASVGRRRLLRRHSTTAPRH